jgi:hypothetical protein
MDPISLHIIDKGVKPVYACPYTVPRAVEQQLRTSIARLVDIGILKEDYTAEWASSTFAIPKKNGTIRLFLTSENSTSCLNVTHFQYPRLGT